MVLACRLLVKPLSLTNNLLLNRLFIRKILLLFDGKRWNFLVGITVSLDYNKNNIVLAKNLRKNATPQENHLWFDFLSKYEIRFQRQKAIGNYIADFYCHKAKLIIEIDGSQHYSEQGLQSDAFRTEVLEGYNLKVLRFTNIQIDTNFVAVCQYIDHVVKAALREGGGPR
ncbi:MAG: endonuclease domain-containing protein [Clostridia bacterium]|nr:endonuclease domain-containing protein [Clostridia bacterium]